MLDNLQITNQDDWEYFPVYTGHLSTNLAFEYFERMRNNLIDNGADEKIVNKLRWVPNGVEATSGLNYLPYIILFDIVIEVENKNMKMSELEEIRDWFKDYIILKDEGK